MRLDLSQQMRPLQIMKLAPHMIQSMEILQMPIMALQERIQQELQENPVLELREVREDEPSPTGENGEALERQDPDGPTEQERELVVRDDNDNVQDFDRLEKLSEEQGWEEQFSDGPRISRNRINEEADRKHDAMQNLPSRPQSLHDHLTEEIGFLEIAPELAALARFLVTHLDERGFLTAPLEEIVKDYERPVTPEEAEEALRLIQKLEPAGVGARNLRECLLLQLTPDMPHADTLRILIENHLEDIEHNRLPVIQRRTGYDLATIKEALEAMRHLNPRPGAAFSNNNTQYAIPDIVIDQTEDGDYQVRLLDDYIPNVYISRRYVEMLKDRRSYPEARDFLKKKLQSAQWLLQSIEQRRSTLEKVAKAIVRHQKAFLDQGPEHIEPLKMQQIADEVKVHVTTVSRAVDDKWVQTPRGVFPLKRFFCGGTKTAEGEDIAWETIKKKLQEIIDKEDKANPYSDDELVNKLAEVGYPLARRTVTKYRKMLRIPSSRQRKDWTLPSTRETPHEAASQAETPVAETDHALIDVNPSDVPVSAE